MAWIFSVIFVLWMAIAGIRRAQRAGQWSWSKFAFSLGFAAFECALVTAPLVLSGTRYFMPVYIAAWVVAAVIFVWFIRAARRWKLPDGPP